MVRHVRPLRASDGPKAERLAKLTQVNQSWIAFAPQHGQAPQGQQRGRAYDSGPDLFDVGVIEREPDPPHFRVGVRHRVDGQHLGRFHAPLGPPAPPTPRPSSLFANLS